MNYSYICPHCGHQWINDRYNTNECKSCGYWQTICSYADGDTEINKAEYQRVLSNIYSDTKYLLQCVDCGKQTNFYFDQWITCDCGGIMQQTVDQANLISRLKEYRKKKKLTQQQMAEKFGLSRSYYADMEQGKKTLTRGIIDYISKQKIKK